ncbi:uncharacterized protein LOC115313776 [Ixodes scapularis]|uniref:uncharacterized protein LOC115313776 n=1 Tax=Ixodes scapularis TaxID=6945 RepID=UPI001A9F8341|nr:uncharacterized protein LOC115313776 [Ixodes scapularis]
MNTFLKLAITALCAFIPCKANKMCSCPRQDYLEGLPDHLEYRSAKDFLTSRETLYLKYLSVTVSISGIQCVTSTLRGAVKLPEIPRWIYYTDATSPKKREKKAITLYMSNETYFTTEDFPQIGHTFPIVFADSKCMIYYILKDSVFGNLGCALWVKARSKDSPLLHCQLIYLFFCDTSFKEVYNKEACDDLVTESEKPST